MPAGGLADKFPWIIAGLAVLALIATVIVVLTKRPTAVAGAGAAATGAGEVPAGEQATTDLSSMTPREAADRLYERVARAAAAGDSGQVTFFGPMALQAYGNVSPLDADARLHIGLIDLNLNNPAGALAQADTIAKTEPTHLFIFVLRAQAATQRSDAAAARRAYQGFTRNYDAEMRKNLPEYQEHKALIDEVRSAAGSAGS